MACLTYTLTGIAKGCRDNVGGIQEVYIIDHSLVTGVTATNNKISAITLGGTGGKFRTYAFRKQTGTMTSTINVDEANGTTSFSTELNLKFGKLETAKRLEIVSLAMGEVSVIVKDGNGKYWFLGKSYGVSMSAGTAATGTAIGDFAGYDITLLDLAPELPYEVDSTILAAILDGNQSQIG